MAVKFLSSPKSALAAGCLGFCLMAALGWQTGKQPDRQGARSPVSAPARPDRPAAKIVRRGSIPAKALQELQAIRETGSVIERQRAIADLVESLPPAELLAWLEGRWFSVRGGSEIAIFTELATQKLATEDPARLLESDNSVFSYACHMETLINWARRDPDGLTAYLTQSGIKNPPLEALVQIAQQHPAAALARLRLWLTDPDYGPQMADATSPLLHVLAGSATAELTAMLPTLPPAWKKPFEVALGEERLMRSFHDEIRSLWSRPDGFPLFAEIAKGNETVGTSLLQEIASLPPEWQPLLKEAAVIRPNNSAQWLETDLEAKGFPHETAQSLWREALDYLIRENPTKALTVSAQVEMDHDARMIFVKKAFEFLHVEPAERQRLIDSLPTEEERGIASETEESKRISCFAAPEISPENWLKSLGGEVEDQPEISQTRSMLTKMDPAELTRFSAEYTALPEDRKYLAASLLAYFGDDQTASRPLEGQAIQYLLAHPAEGEGRQASHFEVKPELLSSTYAVKLSAEDPAAAVSWVAALPEGEVKRWTQKNLAAQWVDYDPPAVEAWLKTLPQADQQPVRDFMKARGR